MCRVTRGGSHNTPTDYLRCSNRLAMLPGDKSVMIGFRIVQAEYPSTAPLQREVVSESIQQKPWKWEAVSKDQPIFHAPQVFVKEPLEGSKTPFYPHNHQPTIPIVLQRVNVACSLPIRTEKPSVDMDFMPLSPSTKERPGL